jgi:putative hydrolase of the HAD superfamily
VIFDAFNTLVKPVRGFERTFVDALSRIGIDGSAAVMAHLQSVSAGLDHRQWSTSRDEYLRWTAGTLASVRPEFLAEFASGVMPALEQLHQAPMEQFPDVAGCLEVLRSGGMTIAVCSNWGWDLAEDLASAEIAGQVGIMVSSAQAGCRKPHRDIYRRVLDAAGVRAADAIFVGDNLQADVVGPQLAGIDSVLLDRSGVQVPGHPTIASLRSLAGHIRL